jgi:hypothetical protein
LTAVYGRKNENAEVGLDEEVSLFPRDIQEEEGDEYH